MVFVISIIIAVVAFFTGIDLGIPASVRGQAACPAFRWTGVPRLDVAARRVAPIKSVGVAVVAGLVASHDTVTADYR